jgi:16S rRNA (guanine966-N2)-methyltransferase
MRIIAGTHRGTRIEAPQGLHTRPTSDRAREAAFNLLGPVDGATVLDLYAGSGAMGLEALSRGASRCLFVDSDRRACAAIERNVARLRIAGADVRCRDALAVLREEGRAGRVWDLILADPPYDAYHTIASELAVLVPAVLADDGIFLLETSARDEPELDLESVVSRRYGSARITLFTR